MTLALPQDVQTEAFDYPAAFLEPRVWTISAPARRRRAGARRALVRARERPLIVAGGGVIYSEATDALRAFAERPASRSARRRPARARCPRTIRWRSARSASPARRRQPARARGRPRDRRRHALERLHDRVEDRVPGSGRPLRRTSTSRASTPPSTRPAARRRRAAALEELRGALAGHRATRRDTARARAEEARRGTPRSSALTRGREPLPSQAEVIGAVNDAAGERDVVVCAAGSLPGDLHKLWRARDPKGYHLEYGYSCMGYEIAGRPGRQDGRARARGLRDGRRRLVPDDGAGDRHGRRRRASSS